MDLVRTWGGLELSAVGFEYWPVNDARKLNMKAFDYLSFTHRLMLCKGTKNMATQGGIIQLSGKLGDLIFSKKKGRNAVRSKSSKPINQTEASKKSSADFGAASSAAAKIRKAFKPLFVYGADDTIINRLNKQILAVFKTISQDFSGNKKLMQGDIKLLTGFQFSSFIQLDTLLFTYPTIAVLLPNQLNIAFGESTGIKQIERATTAVIELMCYNMDLNGDEHQTIPVNPLTIPLISKFRGAKLNIPLVLGGDRAVLVAIAIHYLDDKCNINSRRARAGSIVFASKYKDGIEVPFLPMEIVETIIEEKPEGLAWELG
ncbi:hypothetical protein [Pedobacter insulae]|uniref:Uncharacterized protein n=1 Tax=Pedobacter insulae TaxID=414048 RepID=A0A1I2UL29_9SPHI|nr:hypothetical protein [Pedobacter insulae]SFG76347.1 hypothetical protein SAMN04489864_102156 [Pedobacter insulae]